MKGLLKFGSLSRIERRNLIEDYCRFASLLPIHKRILFQLYYRDGYTVLEISQLLMKTAVFVRRRLYKITEDLNGLVEDKERRLSLVLALEL